MAAKKKKRSKKSKKRPGKTPPKAPKPGKGSKGGRPPYIIDEGEVEKLAKMGATNVELAGFYGVDEGTIRKRFSEILTKSREEMKMRLRQLQFKSATGGNPTMLIWLGKQMLGQTDKVESTGQIEQKVTVYIPSNGR